MVEQIILNSVDKLDLIHGREYLVRDDSPNAEYGLLMYMNWRGKKFFTDGGERWSVDQMIEIYESPNTY